MTMVADQKSQKGKQSRAARAVAFKYYIHDTESGYSLEMFGPFTESSIKELSCCWQTAKTTLKDRKLTLDLRGLTSLDESAKLWLASMSEEGAYYLPASFLPDIAAAEPGREPVKLRAKRGFFGRLTSALRFDGCT